MTGISIPSAAQKSGFRSMWTALSACSTIGTIRHSRNKLNFLLNPNPCRRKSHRLSNQSQPQADEPTVVLTPPNKKKQNALAYPLDANGSNYRITDDHIGEGAPLERFQRNLDAIRTLKTVEAENRSRHSGGTGGAGTVCGLGRSCRLL